MSFAIIQTGGKQYKVKAGEILKVEKLIDKEKVEFKNYFYVICSHTNRWKTI